MRIARLSALVVLLVAPLAAHAQAGKDDKAVKEVVDFRNKYIEAEENRDVAYLDTILVYDFFALNPQGRLLNKAQQLENLKRPDRTLKVTNARDTHVQFYGNGSVAVLTEHVTVEGVDKGVPFGGELRFLRVFTKQNGQWKVVLAQSAPVPQAQTAAK
jgi:ketosteroid isomerase-like protein